MLYRTALLPYCNKIHDHESEDQLHDVMNEINANLCAKDTSIVPYRNTDDFAKSLPVHYSTALSRQLNQLPEKLPEIRVTKSQPKVTVDGILLENQRGRFEVGTPVIIKEVQRDDRKKVAFNCFPDLIPRDASTEERKNSEFACLCRRRSLRIYQLCDATEQCFGGPWSYCICNCDSRHFYKTDEEVFVPNISGVSDSQIPAHRRLITSSLRYNGHPPHCQGCKDLWVKRMKKNIYGEKQHDSLKQRVDGLEDEPSCIKLMNMTSNSIESKPQTENICMKKSRRYFIIHPDFVSEKENRGMSYQKNTLDAKYFGRSHVKLDLGRKTFAR